MLWLAHNGRECFPRVGVKMCVFVELGAVGKVEADHIFLFFAE